MNIALRASRECLVLLKNTDNMLPLRNRYRKIAVIGPNADSDNYIPAHYGPMGFKRFYSVLDGLKRVYENEDVEINYVKGIDMVNPGWPENELMCDTLTAGEQESIQEAVNLSYWFSFGDVLQPSILLTVIVKAFWQPDIPVHKVVWQLQKH